jgi:hypothetical protein
MFGRAIRSPGRRIDFRPLLYSNRNDPNTIPSSIDLAVLGHEGGLANMPPRSTSKHLLAEFFRLIGHPIPGLLLGAKAYSASTTQIVTEP